MSDKPGLFGDEFLTVAEVAETLKMNQQTIRNWIDDGRLPALRIGRRVRIKKADFDALLAAGDTTDSGAGAGPVGFTAVDFWSGAQHPSPIAPQTI